MQVVNMSNKQIKNFNLDTINAIYDTHLNYTKTRSINCSHNLLGSTDGFSQFQCLYNLDLSHNRINQFFQLSSCLVELNLAHNQLGSVFDDFQKSLKSQGTRLYVGSFLSNLKNLRIIDLSYNSISSISSNIFDNNIQLRKISLSNNQLSCALWCFTKLDNLEIIDVGHNQLNLNDLKPLEKLKLESLNLRFNPLENVDKCEDKLIKYLLYTRRIELSYTQLEQQIIINSKQSSKLDHSINSNDSMQQQTTDRSTITRLSKVSNRLARPKTPQNIKNENYQINRTPVKVQNIQEVKQYKGELLKKNISITPKKNNQNKTPKQQRQSCIKTIDQNEELIKQRDSYQLQKSTSKIPALNLQILKVTPFQLSEVNSEREDFPMLFEEDDEQLFLEQLKMLGEAIKQKKQQEVSIERQITMNKNMISLMKIMIKDIYLYNINDYNQGFDDVMTELHTKLQSNNPNFKDIQLKLMKFNNEHSELNQMYSSLQQFQRIVDNIKQQLI
ncbi:unnamed protein product [Paramecium sonneborni]|uniref:Leucine Rich Repeat family protein n=1 Tax=Paramecium sonneborni TaxID=65129 RepID=A0A8S1RGM4_9CILI|nr:unnamed protein product [Paramecium sonneborni]